MAPEKKPDLLKLVGEDHPILHKRTIDVKFPLSDEDKHLIASMRYSIQSEQLIAAGGKSLETPYIAET